MMTSELLEALKVGNSIINGCDTHFTKPLIFFHMFTLQALLVSKLKVCIPSTNFKWSSTMMTSELLEALKVGNSIINGCDTHFTKPLIFFHMFTLQALSVGVYQRLGIFFSRSKG